MKGVLQLVLCSQRDDAIDLFGDLGDAFACTVQSGDNLAAILDAAVDADVLVVDLADEAQEKALEDWIRQHADAVVYALTDTADVNNIRRLMRTGIRDVFARPLARDEIVKELEQVMATIDAEQKAGKVITFLNVKGGSGSTTMAVNTALELARDGKLKTLLIDMDIQFGDVAPSLDVHPVSSVSEALSQAGRLDVSLLGSMVSRTEDNLDVLASPARLGALDAVRPDDIHKLLDVALQAYDVIVVDLPRVITPWTNEVMRWSDHLFLVVQGAVSSVRDAHLIQEHLQTLGVNNDTVHYVHNRAGAKHAGVDAEQMKKSLKTDRLLSVHNDYDVAQRASDMGKAVRNIDKGSKLAKDLRQLADVISTLCGHEKVKSGGGLSSLFRFGGEA